MKLITSIFKIIGLIFKDIFTGLELFTEGVEQVNLASNILLIKSYKSSLYETVSIDEKCKINKEIIRLANSSLMMVVSIEDEEELLMHIMTSKLKLKNLHLNK